MHPTKTLLAPILGLGLTLSAQADLTLKQEGSSLKIMRDGKLVTQYRTDKHVPCLYPLIGPTGTNLTRNFPFKKGVKNESSDHPHHLSAWFTHGSINGLDFWTSAIDPECKIKHLGFEKTSTASKSENGVTTDKAQFTVDLSWNQKEKSYLREKRTYSFTYTDDALAIDVKSTLTAPNENITFGDTKEGSFAIRLTPTLRLDGKVAKGHILNSEGQTDNEVWGKRAKWVAYEGPDSEGNEVTVAIFDHPGNLRYPTWWHARGYGLLAANPFGQHDFEGKKDAHLGDYLLKKGDSLTLNYRLYSHKGELNADELAKTCKDFSGKK